MANYEEWTPYIRGIYRVDGKHVYNTDDPKDAIKAWMQMQIEDPTNVAIMCETKEQAVALVKAGTAEYLTEVYNEFPECPYKLNFLIEECKRKAEDGCKGFYENKYGYGDSVHPFGVG